MKKIVLLLVFALAMRSGVFGQWDVKNGVEYSQPIEVDSLENFLIGKYVGKNDKNKYNLNTDRYNVLTGFQNVFYYSATEHKVEKIFKQEPAFVYIVLPRNVLSRGLSSEMGKAGMLYSTILRTSMVFSAKTDEYNKDGMITDDDPTSLFISTNKGTKLTRITSPDMNVVFYLVSNDQKVILVTIQQDKNGNKRFDDEDELLYQINLDDDFSKIKMVPIKLE